MIGVVDYGSGNINAISTVYKNLNIDHQIIKNPSGLLECEKIILPGVGAFDATMLKLNSSGFKEVLDELVLNNGIPILGICVGLQVMGNESEEGMLEGLGWIPGKVTKFSTKDIKSKPKLPHMGWNTIADHNKHPLFEGVDCEIGFYFIHSYHFKCESEDNILSSSTYHYKFTSSINFKKIFGVQFHPEKSHHNGIQLLKNFAINI